MKRITDFAAIVLTALLIGTGAAGATTKEAPEHRHPAGGGLRSGVLVSTNGSVILAGPATGLAPTGRLMIMHPTGAFTPRLVNYMATGSNRIMLVGFSFPSGFHTVHFIATNHPPAADPNRPAVVGRSGNTITGSTARKAPVPGARPGNKVSKQSFTLR